MGGLLISSFESSDSSDSSEEESGHSDLGSASFSAFAALSFSSAPMVRTVLSACASSRALHSALNFLWCGFFDALCFDSPVSMLRSCNATQHFPRPST